MTPTDQNFAGDLVRNLVSVELSSSKEYCSFGDSEKTPTRQKPRRQNLPPTKSPTIYPKKFKQKHYLWVTDERLQHSTLLVKDNFL